MFTIFSLFLVPVVCEKKCQVPFSRCVIRNGTQQTCECIGDCHKVSKPVCGSDGVTYDNECLLQKTACEKNKEIKVVNNGSCQGMLIAPNLSHYHSLQKPIWICHARQKCPFGQPTESTEKKLPIFVHL